MYKQTVIFSFVPKEARDTISRQRGMRKTAMQKLII